MAKFLISQAGQEQYARSDEGKGASGSVRRHNGAPAAFSECAKHSQPREGGTTAVTVQAMVFGNRDEHSGTARSTRARSSRSRAATARWSSAGPTSKQSAQDPHLRRLLRWATDLETG